MSIRFKVEIAPALIEKHLVAYLIVTEILRNQSQPITVFAGDDNGLAFALRVNLNRQQCDRLIVREIEQNLLGYSCALDWDSKTLTVTKDASTTSRKKAAKARQPATAGGDADSDPI